MKGIRFVFVAALLTALGMALGCERRSDTPRDTSKTPSQVAPQGPLGPSSMQEGSRTKPDTTQPDTKNDGRARANESAVASITEARCDRETRCNNVGAGKKFESRSDCLSKTRASWRDDLNALECPGGVVENQLTSCLSQIRSESCGNPLDTLGRALACRAVDLCKAS
jgi:hypothetical protein